jgi:hypothetical protein
MTELESIQETVRKLPPQAQRELEHFINYLQYKYRPERPEAVVALSGLWEGIDLDVSDRDVRALRRQVTNQLSKRGKR